MPIANYRSPQCSREPQGGENLEYGSLVVEARVLFQPLPAALCTVRHGVRSQAVPIALVGECSIPVVCQALGARYPFRLSHTWTALRKPYHPLPL